MDFLFLWTVVHVCQFLKAEMEKFCCWFFFFFLSAWTSCLFFFFFCLRIAPGKAMQTLQCLYTPARCHVNLQSCYLGKWCAIFFTGSTANMLRAVFVSVPLLARNTINETNNWEIIVIVLIKPDSIAGIIQAAELHMQPARKGWVAWVPSF